MKNGVFLLAFWCVLFTACSEDSPTEVVNPVVEFTLGSMTDSRDGQTYKTVTIGSCPEGWHVPTQSEFDILYKMIGGKSTAGTKLKSISGWDEEKNGIDAFGFGLLPAGFRYDGGQYMGIGENGSLWSASEYGANAAIIQLFSGGESLDSGMSSKSEGSSLRCVKDSE